jgi:predicted Zn finger-like uncharacterized protein
MIVTCPACQTRYLVDEAELGDEAGRRVRCASCGNLWFYSSEAALIQRAVAEATAEVDAVAAPRPAITPPTAVPSQVARTPALRAEPGTQVRPLPGPAAPVRPAVAVAPPPPAGRPIAATVGFGLLVLAVSLVLIAVLARDRVVAIYPAAAPLYERLHLSEPGVGLRLTSTLTRTADSLIVAGDIVNGTGVPERLPRLRVTLRDGARSELEYRIIDPPIAELPPGLTVHYDATFEHPSITAVAADVGFVTD